MEKKKLISKYIIEFYAIPKMIGKTDLTVSEIEYIVKAICDAALGVQGISTKCRGYATLGGYLLSSYHFLMKNLLVGINMKLLDSSIRYKSHH